MTKSTQGYSLAREGIECNLINDKDDKYDNNTEDGNLLKANR